MPGNGVVGIRRVYNRLFPVFFWLAAPYYFVRMWRRGHWRSDFQQRFGRYTTKLKQSLTNRQVVWLHAVSVGEVNICTQLIRVLEPRLPNLKIIVSTTTTTGMEELRRKLPSHIARIYYPVDMRKCVQRALSTLHPAAIVLVEAEIWPNLLWQAQDRDIPVFLVNARLSDRSYRGYKRWRKLFRPLFASFAGIGVPNEADAAKLRELGAQAIHVVGNLKFDAAKLDERRLVDVPALLSQLGVAESALVLVGGSTHAGEEALLAEQYRRLKLRFPNLFLVLVPRHFERGREVGRELAARGVKFVYRSEITPGRQYAPRSVECLLVNTTGELKHFYEQASLIFVGKSLTAHGGQNPIEPGALAKAMVFGPYMENFTSIAAAFVARQGAVQAGSAAELERVVGDLLADANRREELGQNALKVVQDNRGAIDRTADMIVKYLRQEQDTYVATPE